MDDHRQPPASPTDDLDEIIVLSFYTFGTIGLPLFILLVGLYCWARKRLWDCCCYYDVESALETQSTPPVPPGAIPFAFRGLPCLSRGLPEPPRWELDSPAVPPPERILEISAACTECAICTGALEGDGERCSTLPLCGHRFHKVCVYIWLHRKATCPVCRRFYPFPVRSKLNLLLKQERDRLLGCA